MTEQQEKTPTPDPPRHRGRLPSGFSTVRDLISFVAGLSIIGNEVFISGTAEPTVIAVGVTLTGLPLVFGVDEKKPKGGGPTGGDGGGEAS